MTKKQKTELVQVLEAYIAETHLFKEGAKILIAVSGGPDSMALFALLKELQPRWALQLHVLHCHHGLRPEAEEEADFVRLWAKRWETPFSLSRLAVREFKMSEKRSWQDAARDLRYRAFVKTAQEVGAEYIALGHTADDQAEEILIGLIRGAGLGGLCGMPWKRGPFIRPLLGIYRSEVEAYLQGKGIPYRQDPSNRDFRYLRARVRHHLVPELKKYSPRILVQLNRTARLLQRDEAFLQEKTEEFADTLLRRSPEGMEISRAELVRTPPAIASRLLQKALLTVRGDLRKVGTVHLEALLGLVQSPKKEGRLSLPGGWTAVTDRETLFLVREGRSRRELVHFQHEVMGPGTVVIPETGDRLIFRETYGSPPAPFVSPDPNLARVDGEMISWPILVRSAQPGDRFTPYGREGSKKVARFMMDRKIPKERRRRIPLVLSQNRIVWVAGVEIEKAFSLSSTTQRILEMEYQKGDLP